MLASSQSGDYLAADVPDWVIRPSLRKMRSCLGIREYLRFRLRRLLRDGAKHHLTVIAPPEFRSLPSQVVLEKAEVAIVGLGVARACDDIAYYVVVESPELQQFRRSLGLEEKDFHITLGFRKRDIHGVPKGRSTLLASA